MTKDTEVRSVPVALLGGEEVDSGAIFPLVSVYITTKNRLNLLRRAVESVFNQTYKNIEIIVVDDASDDGSTKGYLSGLHGAGKLTAIFLEKSSGANAARNAALGVAVGEFVTGLDDDDYFHPSRIAEFVEMDRVSRSAGLSYSFLYSDDFIISSKGPAVSDKPEVVEFKEIKRSNVVNNQVFTYRSFLKKIGFDEKLKMWQDWDVWVALVRDFGPAYKSKNPTYFFDCSHSSPRISNAKEGALLDTYGYFVGKHKIGWWGRVNICHNLIAYYKPLNHWRFVLHDKNLMVNFCVAVKFLVWRVGL